MTSIHLTGRGPSEGHSALQAFIRQFKTTLFFTYFELKKSSASNGLGLAWLVLEPLVRMMIYVFVFTVVLRVRLPGNPGAFSYAVYILMGLVPWMYINSVLNDGASLVHSYAGFIRQPNFPYRILPNVNILKHLSAHLVGMVVLLTMIVLDGGLGKINVPLLLLVYVLMFMTMRGIATFLGACAAVVPDVRPVLNLVLMLAIYLSPILYLPSQLGYWIIIGLVNPFSYVLTSYKYAMTGEVTYTMLGPWADLSILVLIAIASTLLERRVMQRIRHSGIDRVV